MEQKTTKKLYRRRFLNKPHHHSTALVLAEITETERKPSPVDESKGKPNTYYLSCDFTISDCSRSINLSFDAENESAIRNSLSKIKNLKKVIEDFEQAFSEVATKKLVSLREHDKFARAERRRFLAEKKAREKKDAQP
jgi:hypothetical protein